MTRPRVGEFEVANGDRADPKSLSTQLPALSAGQYLVRWSTMTRDGHKVMGEYRFKVK